MACPFFTDIELLKILKEASCGKIHLLVRLCESTSADALLKAKGFEGVDIRYYTSQNFHAKFYILGSVALIGSANLTRSGLLKNRELSIEINSSEEKFHELPAYFDELWSAPPSAVLTVDALKNFKKWGEQTPPTKPPEMVGIPKAEPTTIKVKSQTVSKERTYLESFKKTYYETLIPAYRVVKEIYYETGQRHPLFINHTKSYEIDRFLFWARGHVSDENLLEWALSH